MLHRHGSTQRQRGHVVPQMYRAGSGLYVKQLPGFGGFGRLRFGCIAGMVAVVIAPVRRRFGGQVGLNGGWDRSGYWRNAHGDCPSSESWWVACLRGEPAEISRSTSIVLRARC